MRWVQSTAIVALLLQGIAMPATAAQPRWVDQTALTAPAAPVCVGSDGYAQAFEGRRTFLWRPDWLADSKRRFNRDPSLAPARKALLERADAALTHAAYTVVDKTRTPASGDPHDYLSMGPYWWPDPTRPDGLPYVRRDGKVNPERDGNAFDLADLDAMSGDVEALALAHYFTGEQRYADKAGELLRAWFIAPATRMNPNFNHAQAVPGKVSGRAEGVIDAHRLARVVEAIGLLGPSGALSTADNASLQAWFAALVDWMQTSPIGRAEQAAQNNHGIFFDTLISQFALFARLDDVTRAVSEASKAGRIGVQVAPDGSLPRELARTRSLHYTAWTLAAAMDLADEAGCVGVDLWTYRTEDGRSLRAAVDFLGAYAGRTGDWPYPELDKAETADMHEVMLRAAWAWHDPAYAGKARADDAANQASVINLLVPTYARPPAQ